MQSRCLGPRDQQELKKWLQGGGGGGRPRGLPGHSTQLQGPRESKAHAALLAMWLSFTLTSRKDLAASPSRQDYSWKARQGGGPQ